MKRVLARIVWKLLARGLGLFREVENRRKKIVIAAGTGFFLIARADEEMCIIQNSSPVLSEMPRGDKDEARVQFKIIVGANIKLI